MPKEFSSLSDAQAAYDALEADATASAELLTEAQANAADLTAKLATATADLEASQTANADLTAKLTAAETAATEATAEIDKLKAEAKTAEAIAAQICASLNIDPQQVNQDGGGNSPGTMTRAEFEAKPLRERPGIIKSGVKITE